MSELTVRQPAATHAAACAPIAHHARPSSSVRPRAAHPSPARLLANHVRCIVPAPQELRAHLQAAVAVDVLERKLQQGEAEPVAQAAKVSDEDEKTPA